MDTSALAALVNVDDKNHLAATAFREKLREGNTLFNLLIISNYVFDETMTLVRSKMTLASAISLGNGLRNSNLFKIAWITPELDFSAWEIFVKYQDRDFSYTDCTSFALMREDGINKVFAFDEHFSQFGFEMIP